MSQPPEMNKAKIAGGMFGLDDFNIQDAVSPSFLQGNIIKLVNGRSCISVLFSLLQPRKVWLPSYLCHTIIDAISERGNIAFYPINQSLEVSHLDWVKGVGKNDLVLFIDYFGFDLHRAAMIAVKETGAWIIQDAAQALLSTFTRPYADFILYSPRKTVGVPDGGILQSCCDVDLSCVALEDPPSEYTLVSYQAYIARTLFDRGHEIDWFALYKKSEQLSVSGAFRMSAFSEALLLYQFDYKAISNVRRANYQHLYCELKSHAVLGALPKKVVPMGMPIKSANRDQLISKLYEEKLFCPIHWPTNGFIPDEFVEAHQLSQSLLTVLCDHRIMEDHLNMQKKIITSLYGN